MSGDIRSSDSEDVSESSENQHALKNGNLTGHLKNNDAKNFNNATKKN